MRFHSTAKSCHIPVQSQHADQSRDAIKGGEEQVFLPHYLSESWHSFLFHFREQKEKLEALTLHKIDLKIISSLKNKNLQNFWEFARQQMGEYPYDYVIVNSTVNRSSINILATWLSVLKAKGF